MCAELPRVHVVVQAGAALAKWERKFDEEQKIKEEKLNELGVVQVGRQNGISHGQCHGAVGPRKRREPLVTRSGRIRQPHVKRHQLGTVAEPSPLNAIGERHVSLMRFKGVGAEVEDVLRVLNIVEVPVALPEVS